MRVRRERRSSIFFVLYVFSRFGLSPASVRAATSAGQFSSQTGQRSPVASLSHDDYPHRYAAIRSRRAMFTLAG